MDEVIGQLTRAQREAFTIVGALGSGLGAGEARTLRAITAGPFQICFSNLLPTANQLSL